MSGFFLLRLRSQADIGLYEKITPHLYTLKTSKIQLDYTAKN